MKTLRLIALLCFIAISALAQETSIKGTITGISLIPGRGMVKLTVTNAKGTFLDSCRLGLDSSYTLKAKLSEISLVNVSYDYGSSSFYDTYVLLPGESLNTRSDASEAESEFAAKVLTRGNALSAALDAFGVFDNSFNYGLLDSSAFNQQLLEAKQTAIETLLNSEDSLPKVLQEYALNTIELKAAEIYLNYAYLARFQQKNKVFRYVSPLYNQPIQNIAKLKVYPFPEHLDQQKNIDSLSKLLVKVNFDTEKLSPAYRIQQDSNGFLYQKLSYQLYPKSDGPNCNYGYTALSKSMFDATTFANVDVAFEEEVAAPVEEFSAPEGWLIAPKYERAFDFNQDGLAIVLDGMHYKLINIFGETVLQGGFESLEYYDSAVYIARKYSKYGLIDASGKSILDFQYEDLYALGFDLFAFRFAGSPFMGMMDIKGNEIVKPKYSSIQPFQGREYALTVFYDYKKWTPERVNKNLIKVPGEKYGVIDRNGREVLAPGWYSIVPQAHSQVHDFPLVVYKRSYSSLIRRFRVKNNYQMLDVSGKLYAYNKQYPILNMPGKHYYFTSNLEESVIRSTDGSFQSKPFEFNSSSGALRSMGDDYFVLLTSDEKFILLKDTLGKMQMDTFQTIEKVYSEYDYEYNDYESSGSNASLYYIVKDNCFGLMKPNGKVVLPMIYDAIDNIDSLLFVKYKDKYAVFDTAGNQLTPYRYTNIEVFSSQMGLLKMETENNTQICDRQFKVIFEAPSKHIWMDGSNNLEICNWSYIKDDLLWQYNRTAHVLPYKDTVHYRYLGRGAGLDYHVVNKQGKWLGTVEEELSIDESKPLIVSRFGEKMVVDLQNNNELKGSFSQILPLFLHRKDENYTSNSYMSNETSPKYYLFVTESEKRGLTNANFKWLLDTSNYNSIVVSKSFMMARADKKLMLYDTLGQSYFETELSSRKQPGIYQDKYVRVFRRFGGFKIIDKRGKQILKSKRGGFDITPKGNLLVSHKAKKRLLLYTPAGEKILKKKVSMRSTPHMGLMRVSHKKQNYFMSLEGDLKLSHPLGDFGYPIISSFPTWLDSSASEDVSDTTRKEWEMGFLHYEFKYFDVSNEIKYNYSSRSNATEIWLPNVSKLRVDPKLAAAFVMVQWLNPESNKVPSLVDLNANYLNFETHGYEDGVSTSRMFSYYMINDSLYYVNPFTLFDEDNRYKFARLLTDKMGNNESINWNVCVKPDRLFSFLKPEFKLTETGVEVIIRSLKVQNTDINEIKIALSKEELLPYLRPSTNFYQWFKKR